jgi:GrpB-like predicted nucleotidyltransferase (UPF0157 family)
MTVDVVPYSADWPQQFTRLTDILREAFFDPNENPARNVYVCVAGTLHVRNHVAVRYALRLDPELRERYGAVKLQLASDSSMDIHRYIAGKSPMLQEVQAASDLTANEKRQIFELNTGL